MIAPLKKFPGDRRHGNREKTRESRCPSNIQSLDIGSVKSGSAADKAFRASELAPLADAP